MREFTSTAIFMEKPSGIEIDRMPVDENPGLKLDDVYVDVNGTAYRIILIRKVWNSFSSSVLYFYFVSEDNKPDIRDIKAYI